MKIKCNRHLEALKPYNEKVYVETLRPLQNEKIFFLISDDMQCNVKSSEILHGIQSDQ